ncbi:unnamed protein product [Danaus chrysippus]|uniref:(African queen) hypothetical protein n=1 Tax=Danaus chrysippus TaxID=151541 RepID=A0A8J2R192_9NEOP|nr:unnamed protein product [Danaus chrysippus]
MKPRTKNNKNVKIDKIKRKAYSDENLQKALAEISKGMSKKLAAKTFQVPRSTIQFRLKNPEHGCKPGPPTILNNEEEEALVTWIKVSSRKGFPKRKEDLIKSVSEFLKKTNRTSTFKNGEKWFKLFLARHPSLAFRTPEAVTAASSTVSENDVRGWFRQINDYFVENNLGHILSDPARVLNGDETNFVLCPKTEKAEGIKKRKEERERKKLEKEKQPAPKKQKKKRPKDEISKILFSEKFYKFDTENIVENKENDRELIDINRMQGSSHNKAYTTDEIEKMLTELDDDD